MASEITTVRFGHYSIVETKEGLVYECEKCKKRMDRKQTANFQRHLEKCHGKLKVEEGGWIKQLVMAGRIVGCANCGYRPPQLSMDALLTAGFGSYTVTRDGETVYSHCGGDNEPEPKKLKDIEVIAAKDPNHDWRAEYYGALAETTYQRQGKGQWLLIRTGMGFA
jgi:ssDNA-binding Zn-finger/Zn-ribbon topoisomerase 1